MRQAVVFGDHNVGLEEVSPPRPGPGEALVRPRFIGICGSDVHIFEGVHHGVAYPVVLGHECTAVVVSSPDGSPPPGTLVAVNPLLGCAACPHCRLGEPHICLRREVLGMQRPGCLADLLAVPAANLLPLHDGHDPALAALFEPLAVALHAANLAQPARGERAIIVGAGNIGLLLAHYLHLELGARVSLVDVDPARVRQARELGFDAAGSAEALDLERETARPLAFECVGRPESADVILGLLPAPRVAVLVGSFLPEASVSLLRLRRWEIRVVGSLVYTPGELRRALEILAGPTAERYRRLLVPRQFELGQIREAMDAARSPTIGTKVLVRVAQQARPG